MRFILGRSHVWHTFGNFGTRLAFFCTCLVVFDQMCAQKIIFILCLLSAWTLPIVSRKLPNVSWKYANTYESSQTCTENSKSRLRLNMNFVLNWTSLYDPIQLYECLWLLLLQQARRNVLICYGTFCWLLLVKRNLFTVSLCWTAVNVLIFHRPFLILGGRSSFFVVILQSLNLPVGSQFQSIMFVSFAKRWMNRWNKCRYIVR